MRRESGGISGISQPVPLRDAALDRAVDLLAHAQSAGPLADLAIGIGVGDVERAGRSAWRGRYGRISPSTVRVAPGGCRGE